MMPFLTIGLCLSLGLNFYMLYEFHSTKTEMEHINNLVNTGDNGQSLVQHIQQTQDSIILVENNLKEVNAQFPDLRRQLAEIENQMTAHKKTIDELHEQKAIYDEQLQQLCANNKLNSCNF